MLERGPELFRLTVYGTPAGAGSKTAMTIGKRGQERRDHTGRLVLVYRPSSKKTEPWMQAVERDAAAGWRGRDVLDGALWVLIDSYETRPKAHFLSDGRLRPGAPAHPDVTETHDSGKIRRATEDALTNARIWADDKRVVDGHDRKHYCDQVAAALEDESWREPRQLIRIGRMKHQTVEEAGIKSPAPAGQEQLLAA